MRISDWSSDVCSSDLRVVEGWLGQADLPVGDEEHPDVPALRAEVRKARRRLDEIAEMLGDGDLDPAGARKARVRAMARLTTAEGELSAVTRTTALSSVTSSADPVQAWRVADLDVRREVIRELMEITVERPGPGGRAVGPRTESEASNVGKGGGGQLEMQW